MVNAERLPAPALRRLENVARGSARGSLESLAGTAGLAVAGFDAVTEVMGCTVVHLGFRNSACGYYTIGFGQRARTFVSGQDRLGLLPAARAVDAAWGSALDRLLAEAGAVGADGVVGITSTRRRVPGSVADDEFVLVGTAVRARSVTRAPHPFATDLSGDRLAALLGNGWVPAGYAVRVSQGIRHDDWRTQSSMSRWTANVEVEGLTELVTATRSDARRAFEGRVRRLGGEVAVVSSMTLRTWRSEAGENHVDHLAEATVSGTALVSFRTPAGPLAGTPLTIMPLVDAGGQRRGGRRR